MFNHLDDPQKIANLIGYKFQNKNLLAQALTRKSAIHSKLQDKAIGHFETLEWLGDKVLDLVVTSLLKKFHPDKTEGELTQLRVKLTKNEGPLPRVACHLGLDKFIIRAPSEELTNKKLADHMEALLGAIFIDCNKNYQVVEQFIENHWALLGLNEDNVSVSDFGQPSLLDSVSVSAKREEQLNRALLKAAMNNEKEKVDLLIDQGAYIEVKDENGNTPLLLAYIQGHVDLMRYLAEEYRANIDAIDDNGISVLHFAAYNNDLAIVEFLLENAAEVNLQTKLGYTPAHIASERGNFEIIKKLYEAEANFLLLNNEKQSVRALAVKNKHKAIINYFDQIYAKRNQLNQQLFQIVETAEGSFGLYYLKEKIIDLVKEGADPFEKNKENKTIFQLIKEKSTLFGPNPELMYGLLKVALPREGEAFINLKLSGVRSIEGLDFRLVNLEGADFGYCKFTNVDFYQANLQGANFDHAQFYNVDFTKANLSQAEFSSVIMDRVSLESFIMAYKNSNNLKKLRIHFNDTDLSGISLDVFDLSQLSFNYTHFDEITLASLLPQLRGGKVLNGRIDLRGVDLANTDLTNIMLGEVYIDRTTLVSLLPQLRAKALSMKGWMLTTSEAPFTGYHRVKPKANLDGLDLSNLDLSDINISSASLYETNFSNTNLSRADLQGCDFSRANITDTNFEEAKIDKITLQSILTHSTYPNYKRISLRRITITEASYLNLSNLDLTNANFVGSNNNHFEFINFSNSILRNVNFSSIIFRNVDFTKADLSYTNLTGTSFRDSKFDQANIEGAKLSAESLWHLLPYAKEKKISFRNINLAGARIIGNMLNTITGFSYNFGTIDFSGLDIDVINLQGAVITQAAFLSLLPKIKEGKVSLQGVTIQGVKSSNLDLSAIDFSGVSFIECEFIGANFTGASLKEAKLKKVSFNQANLSHVNLTYTIFNSVSTKEANLIGVTLTGSHVDKFSLDGLLKHARKGIITLAGINICHTDRSFPITHSVISHSKLSLKNYNFADLNLNDVKFEENTEIDRKFLLSILPQLKQGQLTLKGIRLDFDLKGLDLNGINLAGAFLNKQVFISLIPQIKLNNLMIHGVRFIYGTDLKGVNLTDLNLSGIDLKGVKLNCNHIFALLPLLKQQSLSLAGADLTNAYLDGLDLSGINFQSCNLRNTNFNNCNLQNCNLTGSDLTEASFVNADLSGVNFTNTKIYSSTKHTNFKKAIFSGVNLEGIDWHETIDNLSEFQLAQAINIDKTEHTNPHLKEMIETIIQQRNEAASLRAKASNMKISTADFQQQKQVGNSNFTTAQSLSKFNVFGTTNIQNLSRFPGRDPNNNNDNSDESEKTLNI